MKRFFECLLGALVVVPVVFVMIAMIAQSISVIWNAERDHLIIKLLQRQMEMQAIRRGDAQLTINTNTGDFEVRLKEVAP